MTSFEEPTNGFHDEISSAEAPAAAPAVVQEWAEACVRFVERATSVRLDFTSDTLSVLDHYSRSAASSVDDRAPAKALALSAVAAYLGEVIRRAHFAWWYVPDDDPRHWQLRFGDVFLRVTPYAFADIAFDQQSEDLEEGIEVDDAQQEEVSTYLANLPAVDPVEYRLPSMRYDTIGSIVAYLRALAKTEGLGDMQLTDEDYA